MSTVKLEHYNLMTARLAETVEFYTSALGLYSGFYPTELGPGAWLYDSTDTPVVHMQEVVAGNFAAVSAGSAKRLGDMRAPLQLDALWGTATIDHVAFACVDFDGFKRRLDEKGVPYKVNVLASASLRQLFLRDPNGVIVECNFRG